MRSYFALAFGLSLSTSSALAGDWTGWTEMGKVNNVTLEFKSKDHESGTDVRFQCTNHGVDAIWPSITDKTFICGDGSVEKRSGETCGSSNLKPGESARPVADVNVCKGKQGVSTVKAGLTTRNP